MPAHFADPTIQGLLAGKDVVVLATVQKNGAPLAMPMWFWADTEHLYMLSVDATQKVRNLQRDRRVCVVAESGTRGAEIRGVTVQGHTEFLERPEVYEPIVAQLLRKYDPHLETLWGGTRKPANRVIFRLVPDQVHSWGFAGGDL